MKGLIATVALLLILGVIFGLFRFAGESLSPLSMAEPIEDRQVIVRRTEEPL